MQTSRKVVVPEFITLDGYIVGPDEDVNWVIEGFDAQMHEDMAAEMEEAYDTYVFGRITYEIFAPYWPNAIPYAPGEERSISAGKEDPRIIRSLNESAKVVFSRTLERADWHNTRLLRGGVEDEIRRLKAGPGKGICLQGSASIVQQLAAADLVDEYDLYIHPILLGDGTPLFTNPASRRKLQLTRSTTYPNGVIRARWAVNRTP